MRQAFAGDASVFLVEPRRAGETAAFRLQAISRSAACKVTSEAVAVPIRVGAGVADVDAVMEQAVRAFAQAAPNAGAVAICPFVAEGGHSTCAGVLTDRLVIALDAEARSANRVLKGARLDVRRTPPGTACDGPVTASGRFLQDRDAGGMARAWMELEFRRDGAVIAHGSITGRHAALRPFWLTPDATLHLQDGRQIEVSLTDLVDDTAEFESTGRVAPL